jgi:thiamine biosynthesis lipoprotein
VIVRQEERKLDKLDSIQVKLMNTSFYIAISNENRTDWKKPILSFLHYIEREFSRFHNDNELSHFNDAKKGATIQVSPILFDLLKKAEEYRLQTGGRFSPYMLKQLEAHGYNQSFPFKKAENEAVSIHYQTDSQPLIFQEGCQIIKKTKQKVDLGGIAKGYAVEAAAKWLQQQTNSNYGIVDGGGDMAMWSNGEKTWKIGVMDPFNEDREIGSFSIQNGGIATSNILFRSWIQGETKKHHILDGRTGMPAMSKIVQATVVTDHCLDAEVSAKICFMDDVMSVKSTLAKINDKFSYIFVKPNGEIEIGGNRNYEF